MLSQIFASKLSIYSKLFMIENSKFAYFSESHYRNLSLREIEAIILTKLSSPPSDLGYLSQQQLMDLFLEIIEDKHQKVIPKNYNQRITQDQRPKQNIENEKANHQVIQLCQSSSEYEVIYNTKMTRRFQLRRQSDQEDSSDSSSESQRPLEQQFPFLHKNNEQKLKVYADLMVLFFDREVVRYKNALDTHNIQPILRRKLALLTQTQSKCLQHLISKLYPSEINISLIFQQILEICKIPTHILLSVPFFKQKTQLKVIQAIQQELQTKEEQNPTLKKEGQLSIKKHNIKDQNHVKIPISNVIEIEDEDEDKDEKEDLKKDEKQKQTTKEIKNNEEKSDHGREAEESIIWKRPYNRQIFEQSLPLSMEQRKKSINFEFLGNVDVEDENVIKWVSSLKALCLKFEACIDQLKNH